MTEHIIGLDQQPFFTPALSPISADATAATTPHDGTVSAGMLAAESIALAVYGDLAAMEPLWRAFETEASRTFFQSYDWLASWQSHVGDRTATVPAIVTGSSPDGALLFILPLAVERRGVVRHLTFLGSDLCDYNAPLLRPAFSEAVDDATFVAVWARIVALLRADHRFAFDIVDLVKMPAEVGAQRNPLMALHTDPNPSGAYLTKLTGTWDEFYARKRSSSTRKKERQQQRQLAAFGDIRFVDDIEGEERAKTLDVLFEQKARSFERMGVGNIFTRPGYRELFTAFVMDIKNRHLVHLSRLEVGTTIAAVSIGFTACACYYLVISSYGLGEMAKVGPGRTHLHELLGYALRNAFSVFDFTIGDEAYKQDWSDARITLYDHLSPATWAGGIAVALMLGFRTIKRTIKQNPVMWRWFSRARSRLGAFKAARHTDDATTQPTPEKLP